MKYTIEGFNQRNALTLGLTAEDLVLLRWFVDFKETGDMNKKYIPSVNDMGYWISYNYVIEELPLLFTKHPSLTLDNYDLLPIQEKKDLNTKHIKACKQKLKRMLSGNLAKVLLRNKSTSRDDKGRVKSEIYVHINPIVFKLLISDDITVVQKCTSDTVVQKCTIYPSTNVSYPSTTYNQQKLKDFSSSEKNKNVVLIESKTHLKLTTKNKINKVIKWDSSRLETSIDLFNKENGEYFSLLEKIYKDDKNFAPKGSVAKKKNRFHNFNQKIDKMTEEEVMDNLKASQEEKFGKSDLLHGIDPRFTMYQNCINYGWDKVMPVTLKNGLAYAKENGLDYPEHL